MKLTQDETDFRQIRHQRYQLFYKNVRVEGVEYGLHSHTGQLVTAHGRIVENLLIDVAKPIAERQALEVALTEQKVPVEAYKAQELPKGELLIARLGEEVVRENFQLCYAFEVRTDRLAARKESYEEPKRIYVDATTGKVVKQIDLIQKCFHVPAKAPKTQSDALLPLAGQNNQNAIGFAPLTQSTFIPRWNNYLSGQSNLTFETEQFGSQFRLSHQNGALLTRRDVNQTGRWDSNPEVLNNGTNWGTNNQNATTAHWLTQRVYQFYQQFSQDQNGINRQGTYPHILADYNVSDQFHSPVDAAWNGVDQIHFGFAPLGPNNPNPDYSRTLVTADILGHEYTHAITLNNANLAYQGESGALNESISDIFGTAFERYLFPNNWNYDLGSDSYLFRSMANPTQAHPPVQLAQPEIYNGPNWFPISGNCDRFNDFCGVHENSGVFNKWFHTLCEGQGPNGQMTPKIDFDDATKIVYRALRYYLQSYSGYYDAVYATNNAAGDLFFRCSPQDRAARAAWRAVGIEPGNCPIACDYQGVNYTTANVNCNQPLTLNAGCTGGNFATCTGISYLFSGPNILPNYGPSTLNVTAPANAGTYQYTVSLSRDGGGYCFSPTLAFNVNVNCASQNPCDFSSGPRYVGSWYGLDVQIRQIAGHNVLVTAIPGSSNDKYYPRGDNFWNEFTKDPGAVNLQGCLNAGNSGYNGYSVPGSISPPSGYYQGTENDGAVFYAQNGTNPPNPCDFSSGPRRLGTWNGYEVQIRNFPNGKRALVAAEAGSYNDKYFPRGDNFWDNFTKDAGAEQYLPCLNAGDTDWYGNSMPGSITPPAGYQVGHVPNDGATFFSTNGLRVAAQEAVLEDVRLVTVRPNPARDEVILTFTLKEAADVPVRLLDLQGRVQQKQTFKGVAGKNERVLSVESLPTGLYAIEVMMEGQRIIQKLIKE